MEYVTTIKIDKETLDYYNLLLELDKAVEKTGRDELICKWTAEWEDGLQVDLKIVNSEDGPYIDPVVFNQQGAQIDFMEQQFELEGDYTFYPTVQKGDLQVGEPHIVIVESSQE